MENKCPYLAFTTAEYAFAYIGRESTSKYEIMLGEEGDTDLWEDICRKKIDEAWEEYMRIYPEEDTLIGHFEKNPQFIEDTATVSNIFYAEHSKRIVIAFSELCDAYLTNCFEIPIDPADQMLKSSILKRIKIGDRVKFVSDPWCCEGNQFMPIVAIWSAEGEALLEYEQGYANLMKRLKE